MQCVRSHQASLSVTHRRRVRLRVSRSGGQRVLFDLDLRLPSRGRVRRQVAVLEPPRTKLSERNPVKSSNGNAAVRESSIFSIPVSPLTGARLAAIGSGSRLRPYNVTHANDHGDGDCIHASQCQSRQWAFRCKRTRPGLYVYCNRRNCVGFSTTRCFERPACSDFSNSNFRVDSPWAEQIRATIVISHF